MFKTVLLLLLLLFSSAPTGVVVWGFSAAVVRPASSSRRVLIATHLSATTATAGATLTFTAQIDCTSDPILFEDSNGVTNDDDVIMQFFCNTSAFTQSFLNSNGESFQVLPLSDDYRQLWNDVCDNEAYRYGRELAPPVPSTTVSGETAECSIVMSNANSEYPGLTVVSTITNGVQLLLPPQSKSDQSRQTQHPCYRILLLSDTRTAKGSPVAVWLYNQLTKTKNSTRASTATSDEHHNDDNADENASVSDQESFKTRRPTCRSVATVTLVPWYGNVTDDRTEDDGNSANDVPVLKGHCLHVEAEVNVFIDVPPLVVKLLPMSLERMEHVGSQSIQTTIDADIATALTRTACAMVAWRNGNNDNEKQGQATTSTHHSPLASR